MSRAKVLSEFSVLSIPSLPPTVLHLVRLLLALPPGVKRITEVDWEAGTFRYIR